MEDGSSVPNQEEQQLQSTNEATVKSEDPPSADQEKSLEFADELTVKGKKALKDCDYAEAVECFSRALEIRVAHHGELSPECVDSYYKYGCALLYKAQEEADPLGSMPKKDAESKPGSDKKDSPLKNAGNEESSIASASSAVGLETASELQQGSVDNGEDDEEQGNEESDTENVDDGEEDESDLDLAWKMLDVARAIAEKNPSDSMEKVDILSSLAEVALEREDIQTSLDDYLKALSMLERLVEPDSRHLADLNFRICLCLEVGSKAEEAIPYCQKAISICKSRAQRLSDEAKNPPVASASNNSSVSDELAEIDTLNSLSSDLEKKLEDLQQLVMNPTSILSDILGLVSAKARGGDGAEKDVVLSTRVSSSRIRTINSNGDFDSPTVSTGHTNGTSGVTHLGVVGRGVKRVGSSSISVDSSSVAKKPTTDPKSDKGDSSAA